MNQKQAEYFLEIVSSGSITEAAKRLYITEPALSQIIKNLETELQFPLFIRNTSPIQLTKNGERVVPLARSIISFNQNIQDQLVSLRNLPSYSLRLGVLPGQAQELIPYILNTPDIENYAAEISLTESGSCTIEQQLLDNKLDIGILDGLPTNASLYYLPVKKNRMVLVVKNSSDFAQKHPSGSVINFGEICQQKFIAKPTGCFSRHLLDTLAQTYGTSLQIMYEFENLSHIVELFPSLNCVALMSFSFYLSSRRLMESACYYHVAHYDLNYNEYLVYRKDLYLSDFVLTIISKIQDFYTGQSFSDVSGNP